MSLELYIDDFTEVEVLSVIKEVNEVLGVSNFILRHNSTVDVVDVQELDLTAVKKLNLISDRLYSCNEPVVVNDEFNPYENVSYDEQAEGVQTKFIDGSDNYVKIDGGHKEGLRESVAYWFSTCVEELKFPLYQSAIIKTVNSDKIRLGCRSQNLGKHIILKFRVNEPQFSNMSRQEKLSILNKYVDLQDVFQLFAFDLLIGNSDRHLGNILVREEGGLLPIQCDNGHAFYAMYDGNIMEAEPDELLQTLVLKPMDYTFSSFVGEYKHRQYPLLTINLRRYEKIKHDLRFITYSPAYRDKLFSILDYNLGITKGILWEESAYELL